MLRIPCPVCGVRDHEEFTYLGDAAPVRPAHDDGDGGRWFAYVYLRDNPRGAIREYWHHLHGCREWVIVERDTLTHEISGAELARLRSDKNDDGDGGDAVIVNGDNDGAAVIARNSANNAGNGDNDDGDNKIAPVIVPDGDNNADGDGNGDNDHKVASVIARNSDNNAGSGGNDDGDKKGAIKESKESDK